MTIFKTLMLGCLLVASTLKAAPSDGSLYPNKPVDMIVGFGVGGSADRMARAIAPVLAEQLGNPVRVINKQGAGTLLAANYVLAQADDAYTVFASTFSPYLLNTVLLGEADYEITDFAYINFQWFDEDLLALSARSEYETLDQMLIALREHPNKVRGAVVKGSAGHLMARLILETSGIPQENLSLVTYNSGGQARAAVAGGVVDFILISAEGCEGIREYLRPIAIVSDEPSNTWGVPTLNDALAPLGFSTPVLPGSMRGFAVSARTKAEHPERYEKLSKALRAALATPELQKNLEQRSIGYRWIGSERAAQLMTENFTTFREYSHLLTWGL